MRLKRKITLSVGLACHEREQNEDRRKRRIGEENKRNDAGEDTGVKKDEVKARNAQQRPGARGDFRSKFIILF